MGLTDFAEFTEQGRLNPEAIAAIQAVLGPPDYKDARDHANVVNALAAALTACVIFVTILRLIVRARMVKQVALDDWLLVAATFFTVACGGLTMSAIEQGGFGKHYWYNGIDNPRIIHHFVKGVRYLYLLYISYSVAAGLTKLSIIATYVRIVPSFKFKLSMYIAAFMVTGLMVASVPVIIFQRNPPKAAWDPLNITYTNQLNYTAYLWASGGLSISLNVFLTIVPIPVFWKLQIPRRQKITLTCLFCLSITASVASFMRLTNVHEIQKGRDITFAAAPAAMWAVTECGIGIICTSLPTLRPLCDAVGKCRFVESCKGKECSINSRKRSADINLYGLGEDKNNSMLNINHRSKDPNITVESIEALELSPPSRSSSWLEVERVINSQV